MLINKDYQNLDINKIRRNIIKRVNYKLNMYKKLKNLMSSDINLYIFINN